MRRIDFFGAPGVGKSTLYNEFLRRRKNSKVWMTPREAKIKLALEHLKKSNINKKEFLAKLVLKNFLLKPIHLQLADDILFTLEENNILDKRHIYNEFINKVLLCALNEEKDPTRRLIGLNWFYYKLLFVSLLDSSTDNTTVIFDESLSQKVYGIIYQNNNINLKEIEDYFNMIPPPLCVVYCKLDPEETFNRLKKRKKVIPGHRGLSENLLFEKINIQLELASIGVNVLNSRGVKIIDVNTKNFLEAVDLLEYEISKTLI